MILTVKSTPSPPVHGRYCDEDRQQEREQPRSVLNFETIDEYADLMKAGTKFPTVVVFYDGESYWLADGFHRVKAAWQCNLGGIDAEIIQGTVEDAKWYSFGVNKSHGLRRTNEDKQRAVKAALEHPKSQALSDSQIAKHVGVDHVTVARWREKLSASCEIHKIEKRTVTRGGTTYQQNITNIGHRAAPEAKRLQDHHARDDRVGCAETLCQQLGDVARITGRN